ncbi:hypothetical protein HPB52_021395 [Rhipicephalus sanguineus]|uniref:CCHC-type domain-containing protein n=1 Tax=Rhipicephalus sanguineus TaxID=34632 RepID=A0A9D4PL27_RHISA|nr:hypothetical protein HPB52_021395 [Rhipicephalus sanguineus]
MDMRLQNPLPNFARVGGHRATFEYRGVRRLCRRCNQEGHFKAQCDTPHCARCGVFGHRTDTCTEPCRRCGGAHASVDCTARKSYSMAAAMDVDEFPALGTATAAGQTQRRMTTLRPAKRPKPNEDGPEPQEMTTCRAAGRPRSPQTTSPSAAQSSKRSPEKRQEKETRRNPPNRPFPVGSKRGPSPQHSREGAQHGVQHGEAGGKTSRGEKTAETVLEAKKPAGTPSSDELEPGELVIDKRASAEGRTAGAETLRPPTVELSSSRSGLGAHKADGGRPQRSVKKVRRDAAGRLRSRTSGSEHEDATSKQRPSQRPAADDMDTDSDFF